MNALTKRKPVSKKERNVSVIIEEAALRNITVIIDGPNGRYAINLGEYLGKAVANSIKNLEEIKKAEKEQNDEKEEDGVETEPETENTGVSEGSEDGQSDEEGSEEH